MDSVPASSAPSVPSAQDFQGNIERFSGFARDYDHYRPEPPQDLARLLAAYGRFDALSLVIDLGSGTGLSTRYWADKAEQGIGVDPSADIRPAALAQGGSEKWNYRDGI